MEKEPGDGCPRGAAMSFTDVLSLYKSEKPLIDPAFFLKESSVIYFSKRNDYLTITDLKKFIGPPPKSTDPVSDEERAEKFLTGRASHTLILEGKAAFDNEFTLIKSEKGNREYLTEPQYKTVEDLKTAVENNPSALLLLEKGLAEGVVRSKYANFFCQIRIDWFNPYYGIIDLKTTDSFSQFEREITAYRYYEQLAFFRAILREAAGVSVPAFLIIVGKRELKSEVRAVPETILDQKEAEIMEHLKRFELSRPQEMQTMIPDPEKIIF
ncbi:MAG: PD-(D/E)XK nuclease-like domain-containing protein [Planctomycetia bacterium]|nr:PD-(D/E)XK nuclease-like domain-containing protein [Planctomycetia bacterium]